MEGAPFFDAMHEDNPDKLIVHRATPLKCEGREIVVDEEGKGQRCIRADAIVWGIGWDPGMDFFEPEEASDLGLPVPLDSGTIRNKNSSKPMDGAAPASTPMTPTDPALPPLEFYDKKVRRLFPATLNDTPAQPQDPTTTLSHSRWGLYRFAIPSKHFAKGDRTLAFSGMISSGQTRSLHQK